MHCRVEVCERGLKPALSRSATVERLADQSLTTRTPFDSEVPSEATLVVAAGARRQLGCRNVVARKILPTRPSFFSDYFDS